MYCYPWGTFSPPVGSCCHYQHWADWEAGSGRFRGMLRLSLWPSPCRAGVFVAHRCQQLRRCRVQAWRWFPDQRQDKTMTPKDSHVLDMPHVQCGRLSLHTHAHSPSHRCRHPQTSHRWGVPLHLDNLTAVSILVLANFVFNVEQLSLVCIYFSSIVPGGEAVCFLKRNPGSPIRE